MPQKLAIAISGAVSLGSYQAGVLYEVIEAIAQHNALVSNEEQKIKIDVITGASAGAMTACILAQKLLFDADTLRDPYKNVLYQAWVEKVDIQNLLNLLENDNPNHSIFSSSFIAKIGKELLLDRFNSQKSNHPNPSISPSSFSSLLGEDLSFNQSQENPSPNVNQHPAAADSIRIGIAMSNLNGFDFELEVTDYKQLSKPNTNSFVFTRHQDQFITELTIHHNQYHLWEEIEKIGRSSGAFPFAFQVLGMKRNPNDEVYRDAVKSSILGEFAYTDGGVFENEPLGLAKHLVNQITTNRREHENRFYLYIAPGPKKSSSNKDLTAENANLVNTALALGKSVFTQARFREWIETNQINSKIRQFEAQAMGLKTVLMESPSLSQSFDEVATELLKKLYQENQDVLVHDDSISSRRGQDQQADFYRLQQDFHTEYEDICNQHNKELGDIWIKTVQVLEKSANLGKFDVMKIYAITSEDKDLIGEGLSAFLGFMKKEFRQFDYNVGRINAIKSLQALQQLHKSGNSQDQIYLKDFQLPEKPSLDPQLVEIGKDSDSNKALEYVDPKIRKEMKVILLDRSEQFIPQLLTKNPVLLWVLKKFIRFFLSGFVERLLKLKK